MIMKHIIWMHKERAFYVIENFDPSFVTLLEKENDLCKLEVTLNNAVDLLIFFDLGVRYGMNTMQKTLLS